MDLNERIKLDRQTVEALERIRDNGGNVPDGYVLEFTDDKHWQHGQYPVSDHEGAWWFRLTPIKPSRFTVSTDPCGVLDSERPGWIAWFVDGIPAAQSAVDKLNLGTQECDDYTWSQLSKPQIPLGPEDVPPGSVFRSNDSPRNCWVQCVAVDGHRIVLQSRSIMWQDLKNDFLIKRPGCDTWQACSKDAP